MLIGLIIWLAVTAGLALLTVNAVPPLQFLDIADLSILIEEMKLAFVLLILPLLAEKTAIRTQGLVYYLIFSLLFFPLSLVGVMMSGKVISGLLPIQLFLLILWFAASWAGRAYARWYYLAVFLLGGAVPLLYYLVLEIAGRDWVNILYLNPFWIVYKI